VRRSAKRKRTVGARLDAGVLTITVPSWMSAAERDHWVEMMTKRFERNMSAERIDLGQRAAVLARRYDLPLAAEIRWSDDMHQRWGSCTPATKTIRISNRVAAFPDWVVDYVIVHELCHIAIGAHSAAFWNLVHRYPKAERAIGYLIAKSSGDEDDVGES
jgi:predicted metal-dependent hydrolase